MLKKSVLSLVLFFSAWGLASAQDGLSTEAFILQQLTILETELAISQSLQMQKEEERMSLLSELENLRKQTDEEKNLLQSEIDSLQEQKQSEIDSLNIIIEELKKSNENRKNQIVELKKQLNELEIDWLTPVLISAGVSFSLGLVLGIVLE
jgi:thymidylate synthase